MQTVQTQIFPADDTVTIDRVYSISITIRSFKGRRNVEAHIFRSEPMVDDTVAYDWDSLIGEPMDPEHPGDIEDVKKTLLETFTAEERDTVIAYIAERYGSHLECITACPVELPIPLGVTPLSSITAGKTLGFIKFDTALNYPLSFPVRGFFDIAQHDPLVRQGGEDQE